MAALTLSAGLSSADGQHAGDWPQLLGPHRNGTAVTASLAETWAAPGPPIRWRRTVGEGFAGPVVVAGRVLLFHRQQEQEIVQALKTTSSETLWSSAYTTSYRDDFGFDEGPRATPTVAQGRVFTFGAQGVLQALDLETGERL